jgi:hypothetical protein
MIMKTFGLNRVVLPDDVRDRIESPLIIALSNGFPLPGKKDELNDALDQFEFLPDSLDTNTGR